MPVEKPPGVSGDPFKSAKWDELTAGRSFSASDAPALALLVRWHAVAQRCIDDIDDAGGMVAYQNEAGDIKALPQIAIMKQASAEIRALSKQLGIDGEAAKADERPRGTVYDEVLKRYRCRAGGKPGAAHKVPRAV